MSFKKSAERKPTKAQLNFLELLLNDCGFTPRLVRNTFLTEKLERDITYLDDLTLTEASLLITLLKKQRDGDDE